MGVHLLIEKISETNEFVRYKYDFAISAFEDDSYGIFEFNKKSAEYKIIKEQVGDSTHAVATRAYTKIFRAWRDGSFPDKTEWAS